jgi:hypothetical protein
MPYGRGNCWCVRSATLRRLRLAGFTTSSAPTIVPVKISIAKCVPFNLSGLQVAKLHQSLLCESTDSIGVS